MFMRWRDFYASIAERRLFGLGPYLAVAIGLGTVTAWSFAEVMTGVITAANLAAPRAPAPSASIAAIAQSAQAAREQQAARDLAAARDGEVASQPRPAAMPAKTIQAPLEDPVAAYVSDDGDTYRTVCVRLCDGYFWPISFATNRSMLVADRERCEASCGSPARLYIHRVPGGSPEDMQDLAGQPYTKLKTAYQFRSSYNAACKCNAHPWEQEAARRHKVYALEQTVRQGDRRASAELVAARATVEADRRREQAQKRTTERQLIASGVAPAVSAAAAGPPPSGRAPRGLQREHIASRSDAFLDPRVMRLGGPVPGESGRGGQRGSGTSLFGGGAAGRSSGDWRNRAFNGN